MKKKAKGAAKKSKRNQKSDRFKWGAIASLFLFLFVVYYILIAGNVHTRTKKSYFYVSKASHLEEVADSLYEKNIISSKWTLLLLGKILQTERIKAGLYVISDGGNNFQIIRNLQTNRIHSSVEVLIRPAHLRANLLRQLSLSSGISADSILYVLRDSVFLNSLGNEKLNKESIYTIFIPQTYRILYSCSAKQLIEIIYSGFCNFWNEERMEKAEEIGYSPAEITILASIVYAETKYQYEMPMIAGIYLNRLSKNMRLESDPTLVYATGNYSAKRVLRKFAEKKSDYNTYRKKGLPPGPIYTVPPFVIDAVLNYIPHNYIYFCAKEDFSGCHTFSENFEEHKQNASKYQRALNRRGIK